jgi:hypothetical protein
MALGLRGAAPVRAGLFVKSREAGAFAGGLGSVIFFRRSAPAFKGGRLPEEASGRLGSPLFRWESRVMRTRVGGGPVETAFELGNPQ